MCTLSLGLSGKRILMNQNNSPTVSTKRMPPGACPVSARLSLSMLPAAEFSFKYNLHMPSKTKSLTFFEWIICSDRTANCSPTYSHSIMLFGCWWFQWSYVNRWWVHNNTVQSKANLLTVPDSQRPRWGRGVPPRHQHVSVLNPPCQGQGSTHLLELDGERCCHGANTFCISNSGRTGRLKSTWKQTDCIISATNSGKQHSVEG